MKVSSRGKDNFKLTLVIRYPSFHEHLNYITEVIVFFKTSSYKMDFSTFVVTKDLMPLRVKDFKSCHLLAKHLLKLNSLMKYGSFSIDGAGIIKFTTMGIHEINGEYIFLSQETIEKWFRVNYATAVTTLKSNLPRVFRIGGLLNHD
jgi:hypothetical protein